MYSKENTRIENNYVIYTGFRHVGNCIVCDDEYKSRSIVSKYCSTRCKNDLAIKRRKEKTIKKKQQFKNCIVCESKITQNNKTKTIKYCSPKCKQANYRTNKKSNTCEMV